MDFLRILWDDPNDPDGNVAHVAEHGLDVDDVEEVLANPTTESVSASSGLPCVWGYTMEAIYIIVVYQQIDIDTIRVITAYKVGDPSSGRQS